MSERYDAQAVEARTVNAGGIGPAAGLSNSRYMVECGFTAAPELKPAAPFHLVLKEAEQRALHDSVIRKAERAAATDTE